jgi:hypothetical protein
MLGLLITFGSHLIADKLLVVQRADKAAAQERARQSEAELATTKAKTVELEKKLAPRQITSYQRAKFIELTKEIPKGEIQIFRGDASVETANYIAQVRAMLDEAGFRVAGRGVVPIIGLSVGAPDGTASFLLYSDETQLPDYAVVVQNAFIAIGVPLPALHYDNSGNGKLGPKQVAVCIVNRH